MKIRVCQEYFCVRPFVLTEITCNTPQKRKDDRLKEKLLLPTLSSVQRDTN